MKLVISVRENGSHQVACPICTTWMWLVGIESHPSLPGLVDLATYECHCGKLTVKPHLSAAAIQPPVEAS